MESVVAAGPRYWYRALITKLHHAERRARFVERSGVLAPRSCQLFQPEGSADVPVLQPGIRFYLDLIKRRQGFAFVKRTHGFWDGLTFLCASAPAIESRVAAGEPVTAALVREALSDSRLVESLEKRPNYVDVFRGHFYTALVEDLQNPLTTPCYIEATSFRGYPNSDRTETFHAVDLLRRTHDSFHTSGRLAHDALVWKQAIFDGTFRLLVKAVRDMPVVLIGPPHLSTLGQHLGLSNFHHLVIPLAGAHLERHSVLDRCTDARAYFRGRSPVRCSLPGRRAAVLADLPAVPTHASHFSPRCRARLDVWYPEVVGQQTWFVQNRDRIIANMQLERLHR